MRLKLPLAFLLGVGIAPIAFAASSSGDLAGVPTLPVPVPTLPAPGTPSTPAPGTPAPSPGPTAPAAPDVAVSFSANRRVYMPGHTFVVTMHVRNIGTTTLSTVACAAVALRPGIGIKLNARGTPFLRVETDRRSRTFAPCWSISRLRPNRTRSLLLVVGTLPRGHGPISMHFASHSARIASTAQFTIQQHA